VTAVHANGSEYRRRTEVRESGLGSVERVPRSLHVAQHREQGSEGTEEDAFKEAGSNRAKRLDALLVSGSRGSEVAALVLQGTEIAGCCGSAMRVAYLVQQCNRLLVATLRFARTSLLVKHAAQVTESESDLAKLSDTAKIR
jgi:hypothetical protein